MAVIEFVSQFLLRKIAGAASKVAGKIKAIAQKIGQKLMKALKKVGKAQEGLQASRRRHAAQGQGLRQEEEDRPRKDKKKDDKQDKEDRLAKARAAIPPAASTQLHRQGQHRTVVLNAQAPVLEDALPPQRALTHGRGRASRATFDRHRPPAGRGRARPTCPAGEELRKLIHTVAERPHQAPRRRAASPSGNVKAGETLDEGVHRPDHAAPAGLDQGAAGVPGARRLRSSTRPTPKKGDWNKIEMPPDSAAVHVRAARPRRRRPRRHARQGHRAVHAGLARTAFPIDQTLRRASARRTTSTT